LTTTADPVTTTAEVFTTTADDASYSKAHNHHVILSVSRRGPPESRNDKWDGGGGEEVVRYADVAWWGMQGRERQWCGLYPILSVVRGTWRRKQW